MEKAEYRNSIRSRRLMCDAMLELMNEKPLAKITVTDIVNRADVNRGTFYLHYSCANDIIDEMQDSLIAQMEQYFLDEGISFNIDNIMLLTAKCMKYIYDQDQAKYMPLLFHHQLNFADKVCKRFHERFSTAKDAPKDEQIRKELIVRASLLIHGVIGVFNASENGTLDVTPEQLVCSVDHLVADMQMMQTLKSRNIRE